MPGSTQRLIGEFEDFAEAEEAARQLAEAGIPASDIEIAAGGAAKEVRAILRVRTGAEHENRVIDILESNGSINLDHREGSEEA